MLDVKVRTGKKPSSAVAVSLQRVAVHRAISTSWGSLHLSGQHNAGDEAHIYYETGRLARQDPSM